MVLSLLSEVVVGTVTTGINVLTNRSRESCKVIIKGIGNNLMTCNTPTIKI